MEPLSPIVGAEVRGFDLAKALDGDAVAASSSSSSSLSLKDKLRAALDAHGLLVFRDQHALRPEHHVRCARLFGDVFPLPERFRHARSPAPAEILRVSNDADEGFVGVGAREWERTRR